MKFSFVALLFVLLPTMASSATYQIDWSGELAFLYDSDSQFDLNEGELVSGSILIDLDNLPADRNARERVGTYKDSRLSSENANWLMSSVDGLDTADLVSLYSETYHKDKVKVINRPDSANRYDELRIVDRTTAGSRGCHYFCSTLSYRLKFDSAFVDDQLPTTLNEDDFEFGYMTFAVRGKDANWDRYNVFGFVSIDNVSVTAIPVPAAAWLFLTGLAGVFGLSRKRA